MTLFVTTLDGTKHKLSFVELGAPITEPHVKKKITAQHVKRKMKELCGFAIRRQMLFSENQDQPLKRNECITDGCSLILIVKSSPQYTSPRMCGFDKCTNHCGLVGSQKYACKWHKCKDCQAVADSGLSCSETINRRKVNKSYFCYTCVQNMQNGFPIFNRFQKN